MLEKGLADKRLFEKRVIGKRLISSIAIMFSVLLMMGVVVASANVAYIYRNDNKIDDNVIDVFEEMGLDVDLIDEQDLRGVDFSGYRFLFLGDERFRNQNQIPVDEFPSIISNYYFGEEWGLTDADGISKLASNAPLSVTKDGQVVQVYNRARYDTKPISIPYYYLDDENKVSSMEKVAGTYVGNDYDFGDVVSYAGVGTDLNNGHVSEKKICFFGIVESDYWTTGARNLFEDCVDYVGVTCENDDECGDDEFVGDEFCLSGDVYQDFKEYDCTDAGTVSSDCDSSIDARLVESCDFGCADGDCLLECYEDSDCNADEVCDDNFCEEVVCKENSDCNDFSAYTFDECENAGSVDAYCSNEEIVCVNNLDCNDGDSSTSDVCENAGTVDSYCSYEDIGCFVDSDCDDWSVYTFDECENAGSVDAYCVNSPVNCVNDNDCGFTGFSGNEFCQGSDVFKTYSESVCNNAGTKESYCTSDSSSQMIFSCEDICLGGVCIDINCHEDSDCDDSDEWSVDSCVNPGSVDSYCLNEDIDCLIDFDCDDSNDYTVDNCFNGGSVNAYCDYDDVDCLIDSDCGMNGYVGEQFCSDLGCGGVYKNYRIFECVNPGSISGGCSQTVEPVLIEDCEDVCVDGSCVEITCYNDLDCDDGNVNSADVCNNPGEVDSYCNHGDISCFVDSDCGSDLFVGNSFCSGDDVYRNFKGFSCNNAGSVLSFCGDDVSPELISECDYACAGGECVRCNVDLDCDDGDSGTDDVCRFAGSVDAYCDNEDIICFVDSECGDDGFIGEMVCRGGDVYQNYEEFDCLNAGSVDAVCSDDDELRLVDECDYGCFNGECVVLSECRDGVDNDADDLIDAQDNGCWMDINDPLSYNPFLDEESLFTTECQNALDDDLDGLTDSEDPGCWSLLNDASSYNPLDNDESNGGIICFVDSDCDDVDEYTFDKCRNPGLGNSYCVNEEIVCLNDLDCGEDNYMGNDFCFVDNVFRNFKDYECVNAGYTNSYCDENINLELIEECSDDCVAGACVEIECYKDSDCDDVDEYTFDSCENAGTGDSFCLNEDIVCLSDGDCGDDGFVGEQFCFEDDVYQDYEEFECGISIGHSGCCSSHGGVCEISCSGVGFGYQCCDGTELSSICSLSYPSCGDSDVLFNFCDSDVNARLIENCDYGCAGGECVGECLIDVDCGEDYYEESYCSDDDVYADLHDFGCSDLSCVEEVISEFVEDCGEDSCGDYGENYCSGDDVYNSRMCGVNGCSQGACVSSVYLEEELVENCVYGCDSGECLVSDCADEDDDDYDSCELGEIGDDGNEIDCDDNDDEVNPGAVEVCNQIDDDCDGEVDEGDVCLSECSDGIDNDGDGLIDYVPDCVDCVKTKVIAQPGDDKSFVVPCDGTIKSLFYDDNAFVRVTPEGESDFQYLAICDNEMSSACTVDNCCSPFSIQQHGALVCDRDGNTIVNLAVSSVGTIGCPSTLSNYDVEVKAGDVLEIGVSTWAMGSGWFEYTPDSDIYCENEGDPDCESFEDDDEGEEVYGCVIDSDCRVGESCVGGECVGTCTVVMEIANQGGDGVQVDCPSGYSIMSGGFLDRSGNGDDQDHAQPMGNGWFCNEDESSDNSRCYAVCCNSDLIVSDVFNFVGNQEEGVKVDCPNGSFVTGGGFADESSKDADYIYSKPVGNSWACRDSESSSDSECYAVCSEPVDDREMQCVTEVNRGSYHVQVDCPAGYMAFGGGFMDNAVLTSNDFDASYPVVEGGVNTGWFCNEGGHLMDFSCYAQCCKF